MNKPYLLALNRIASIGPRTILKLLKRWPDLSKLFNLTAAQITEAGFSSKIAQGIARFDLNLIAVDLEWEQRDNHHLITWVDERYPLLLKEIYDPPPVLYAWGDLKAFMLPAVALVGSRKPTATGSENAKRFAYELASNGLSIVSGLALGIDAQAHEGCLQAGGKTIAVMATGMDCIYPLRHKNLAHQIVDNGLILTEFPLGTAPIPGHFPRRNRIISGLSLATLVVEAAIKSGSLITARMALEQNRDVLAIPGSIHNPLARGCHNLVQQGAKLVTSTADVLSEMGLDHSIGHNQEPHHALATNNENLVKCIGFETTSIDQVILRSGLNVDAVVCDLAQLELQGIIKAVPGGYMRCI